MNKKGELTIGTAVILFVGIIVAMAMLGPIINEQAKLTDKIDVTDESTTILGVADGNSVNVTANYVITNIPTSWKIVECPITSFVLTNSTGDALTVTTDYTVDAIYGNFSMVNNTDTISIIADGGNLTLVDYAYCDDGYNTSAASRSVAGLISLFAALIIVAFSLFGIKNWLNK